MQCIPNINPIVSNATGAVQKLSQAKSGGGGGTYRDKM